MSKEKFIIMDALRRRRNRLGISQEWLLKKAYLNFYTIAKIESGSSIKPIIDTVQKSRGV